MDDKKDLINEIKELWKSNNLTEFDIAPALLDYLELKDLAELKSKILTSLTTLTDEQKEWLKKFKSD